MKHLDTVFIKLDDILIHSQTWDQHMKHLDTIY